MAMAKILLVEDDKALREIYGVRLLAEGYDIVSASDGEEALAVAIREKPVLIISDIMMPKISGFEMLDLLRSNDVTKDTKVIMMTALSGDQHRERGERLGADRYLVKSQVGIEDVVNTVHEILGDKAGMPAPAMPAPYQSPVNPPAATIPSTIAGVPAPDLPATPPSVPVVTAPNVAPTPEITPLVDTPTAPVAPATTLDLPPVAPPDNIAPEPALPLPGAVPLSNPANDVGAPDQPTAEPAQGGSLVGARVIQPTGESLSPQVDMTSLIANEEARDVTAQSPAATNPTATLDTPEIQISPIGAVSVDDLPATPPGPSSTFPNQS